jgi:ectoine hydroxylase-related dioxygenase (phytanoyl-CoA dioxygenase family)
MLTLRVHLDDAGHDNAPLLVALGSHRLGRVPEDEINHAVARLSVAACIARAGDVWLCRAPILHASERSDTPKRRRVLQLSYSADRLDHGLEWLDASAADQLPSRA